MTVQASAPAKIILFGEHAVVYGQPAIAVPVAGLRATVRIDFGDQPGIQIITDEPEGIVPLDLHAQSQDALALAVQLVLGKLRLAVPNLVVRIESQIPVASGLGSGAAVSAALIRALSAALGHDLDDATVNELVYEVEKLHHGTPSGVDNTVIVYQQPVFFARGRPIQTLTIRQPFLLLIGDTGKTALTRMAVADVRSLYEADPVRIGVLFQSIGEIVVRARQVIESGQIELLGSLMNRNHVCLQELTVSSDDLDVLVSAALASGALGAKLSGGGRGGNMIALVTQETKEMVRQSLLQAGAARVFETIVG